MARICLAQYPSENLLAHNFDVAKYFYLLPTTRLQQPSHISTANQPSRWRPRNTKLRSRRTQCLRYSSSRIYLLWSCHSCPLLGWVGSHNCLCQHQLDQSCSLLLLTSVDQIEYITEGNRVLRSKVIFSFKSSAAFDLRPAACTLLAARL